MSNTWTMNRSIDLLLSACSQKEFILMLLFRDNDFVSESLDNEIAILQFKMRVAVYSSKLNLKEQCNSYRT